MSNSSPKSKSIQHNSERLKSNVYESLLLESMSLRMGRKQKLDRMESIPRDKLDESRANSAEVEKATDQENWTYNFRTIWWI